MNEKMMKARRKSRRSNQHSEYLAMLEDYIEENLPDKRDSWISWSLLSFIVAPLTVVHAFYIKFYRAFALLFLALVIVLCGVLLYF